MAGLLMGMVVVELDFEHLAKQYEPLIKSTVRYLGMQTEFDDAYQIGLMALWEAAVTFDSKRGAFPAHAKAKVHGRLKSFARKTYIYRQRAEFLPESEEEREFSLNPDFKTEIDFEQYGLSSREFQWIKETYQNDLTTKEIAEKYHVSEHTVRSWKKTAILKIRSGSKEHVFLSWN